MIGIVRGAAPAELAKAERRWKGKLPETDAAPERTPGLAASYQQVKGLLYERQYAKCCYCEKVDVPIHNDVEHYRPWSRYWWLAWSWDNLLFACRACNERGGKEDAFPLGPGSIPLRYGQAPPGLEAPEILDPAVDDPRQHIRFRCDPRGRWSPVGVTWRGVITLRAIGLQRDEFIDLYTRHVVGLVAPVVRDIRDAQQSRTRPSFKDYWRRKCAELLDPARQFIALSEDALRHEFPSFPSPPP